MVIPRSARSQRFHNLVVNSHDQQRRRPLPHEPALAVSARQFEQQRQAHLVPASRGAGPLLRRDYWAIVADCALKPSEVMAYVKSHFCELPPSSLVRFVAIEGVKTGAELDIRIAPSQPCRVRVLHEDAQSITLVR